MDKKKVIFLSIIVSIIGMLITTGTFAFFNWQSNNNKGLSFNVASNLKNYIEYDNGDSTFVGDFQTSSSFTDGIHSTISVKKKQEAASIAMVATINMDINSIGTNMAKSSALKWVVTSGNSSSVGPILSQGNFIGSKNGDTLMLLPNIEVTTSVKEYTIWIWLDINEHPSDALSGETLDTAVWTQIEQLAGKEEIYEITKISANYQRISATVINNKNVITKYAIMATTDTPSSWTNIDANLQNNIYNLEYDTSATGTYYVWFMDSVGIMTSSSISVTNIDTTAPSCTFGEFSVTPIKNNETSQITLTCTDNESTIENHNLTKDNLITSSSVVNVTNVRKEQVTNGYKYTITVTGTETDGSATLTLPANIIRNSMSLGNTITTSTASVTVRNIIDLSSASITLNPTSFTYDGTAKEPTITVIVDGDTLTRNTDYSASFTNNINVGTATVIITGINDYGGSASATFTITKATCNVPTNVSISTAGVVTWTGASNALSYEISIDNTNYTAASSGVDYKSTITASTGNRVVYVRSICDSTNYNTPSTAASTSVSVYSVTLTKGTGVATVTGASNYISGATVSIDASVSTGYTWSNWTSGSTVISTTKTYSATITSDWNYTANATLNTPATPTVSGATTKIYGASDTTLTCNTTTSYATGITKYYSFGYAETSDGSITNWTEFSTINTVTVVAEDYVGDRYYSCRMYVTDGTQTTSSVASSASLMRINNAAVTFDLNGGSSMYSSIYEWTGDGGELYNPLYGRKGSGLYYEGIRDIEISGDFEVACGAGETPESCGWTSGLVPFAYASNNGWTFNGWFTSASGGQLVVDPNNGELEPSVANWTDASGNFIRTSDGTLYAQWSQVPMVATFYYQSNPTAGSTTIASTTASCYMATASTTGGCDITIPDVVRNSVGTWNNSYIGLRTTANNMVPTVADTVTTLTLTNRSYIYYSIYRETVTVYRPSNETTCTAQTMYRNQCFSSTTSMKSTVLASNARSTVNGTLTMASGYTFNNLTTSSAGTGITYTTIAEAAAATATTLWTTETKTTTITNRYYHNYNETAGSTTVNISTASGNIIQTLNCISDTGASTSSNASVDIPIPDVVRNSVGTWNNAYAGLSNSTGSMNAIISSSATAISSSTNTTYYAIYRSSVTNHYYNSGYTNRTLYQNQWFLSSISMSNPVLSTTATGTTNYTTETGPSGAIWAGIATSATNLPEYYSVANAATTTANNLYTVYRFSVSYAKGTNVESIGATSGSCRLAINETSCTVVLPSINAGVDNEPAGWSTVSGATTGIPAGSDYTLNTNGQKLYANGIAHKAPLAFYNGYNTTSSFLSTTIQRQNIESVTFSNSLEGHSANGTDCWDVGRTKNGTALAWATDSDNDGLYEITIGSDGGVIASYNSPQLFANLINLTSMTGMSNFDTSNVSTIRGMFSNVNNLTTLDVSGFNLDSVRELYSMFENTRSLTTLNLSGWNTSKITNMRYMFNNASNLTSLNVSNWNTANVKDMGYMFDNANNLTSLNVSNWNTANVEDMTYMFYNLNKINTLNIGNWNTSNVTMMAGMFGNTKNLTTLDVSNWNTANVTGMGGMFANTTNLTTLNVSNWNTSNVTIMRGMFSNANNLTTLNVSNWNTSNVQYMDEMFKNANNLTALNVRNWNTTKVTNMTYMFFNLNKLTTLDVSNWNTSNVTKMSYLFRGMNNLTSLNVSNWNTSKAVETAYMFSGLKKITSLNVSNWNMSKVSTMDGMFTDSGFITLDLNSWNTSNVQYMPSIFSSLENLTSLNVSNWNISKVKSLYAVFYRTENLTTLNISNWNTTNVTNMYVTFGYMYNITTIYVGSGWDTAKVTNSGSMFHLDEKLRGGSGTTYNASYIDKTYARIDNPPSSPGYFTAAGAKGTNGGGGTGTSLLKSSSITKVSVDTNNKSNTLDECNNNCGTSCLESSNGYVCPSYSCDIGVLSGTNCYDLK